MRSAVCLLLLSVLFCEADLCEKCAHASCCEVKRNEFMCCPYINGVCCSGLQACCPEGWSCRAASGVCEYMNGTSIVARRLVDSSSQNVCCSDGTQCCPSGTECNHKTKVCEPVTWSGADVIEKHPFGAIGLLNEGKVRNSVQQRQRLLYGINNRTTTYSVAHRGTICDDRKYECPPETTCCPGADGNFACCPLSEAVCCSDKLHCCPKDTKCDPKAGRCTPHHDNHIDMLSPANLVRSDPTNGLNHVCPDDEFSCINEETCCQLPSGSWGCCPFPNAVCCSDKLHCCPKDYQCDAKDGACVPNSGAYANTHGVACPGAEFDCINGSTCCSIGNDAWSCCPFENAVCCPDRLHCCPPDTVCDLANSRCVRSNYHQPTQLSLPASLQQLVESACPNGLVACPHGTCCKDPFGLYACCPHPNAVCCPGGHCCPEGMQCDEVNGLCTPSTGTSVLNAIPPPASLKHKDVCPHGTSFCEGDRTCCSLIDGSFGCCPLANGTCCPDKLHCCPADSFCTEHSQCIRRLKSSFTRTATIVRAEKMVSSIIPPSSLGHSSEDIVNLTGIVHATWCGHCANEWFCCPNAMGIRNQKCCPAASGVCCSDGEHCCPRGTRCTGDGHCETTRHTVSMTSAPYLVPAKSKDGKTAGFLAHINPQSFNFPLAKTTSRARLDPLFLLDSYYRRMAGRVTVCPDRERYCSLDDQCCPSTKYGYTCAPSGVTCCSPTSETFCPSTSVCSADGLTCDY